MIKKLLMLLVIPAVLAGCNDADTEETAIEEVEATEEVEETEETVEETEAARELPAPREEDGDYSAEGSSVNVGNFDEFMYVEDALYIDLRDYEDYAQLHMKNFEVIPFFAVMHNEEAHENEEMIQLFGGETTDPQPVYTASEALLKEMFPQDKTLFIMCQSGARVAWMMEILEAYDYDMDNIYNIGGLGTYTDSKYAPYITNTEELTIQVEYDFTGLTRN
ncbi:MAG: hypothetical protein JJU01_08490 [Alkalibacterium sp.]|nr:hypothetical protein [Alkalibacterium sp.]